jgi:PIN domain nuclease of toxin-antitoxin system
VRLLLDTQCWIWIGLTPERFSDRTRSLIAADDTELLFSASSAWEIAIKYAKGRLPLPEAPRTYVETRLQRTRTTPLPMTHLHALRAGALARHHRDPFDRLLIAQAQIEGVPIVTADPQFRRYDVELIEAGSG